MRTAAEQRQSALGSAQSKQGRLAARMGHENSHWIGSLRFKLVKKENMELFTYICKRK